MLNFQAVRITSNSRLGSQSAAVKGVATVGMLNFMQMPIGNQFVTHRVAVVVAVVVSAVITVRLTTTLDVGTVRVMLIVAVLGKSLAASITYFSKRGSRDGDGKDAHHQNRKYLFHNVLLFLPLSP